MGYDDHMADDAIKVFGQAEDLSARTCLVDAPVDTREAWFGFALELYGICECCGRPIGWAQLDAGLCAECRQKSDFGVTGAKTDAKARILVVDVERGKCELLRHLLEGEGYEVDQAHSDAEALTKIEQESFDLILADIRMPGVDGQEMLRRIRDKGTVVIVMTGYSFLHTVIGAIGCDIPGCLINPCDEPDEVLAAVERGLAKRKETLVEEVLV